MQKISNIKSVASTIQDSQIFPRKSLTCDIYDTIIKKLAPEAKIKKNTNVRELNMKNINKVKPLANQLEHNTMKHTLTAQ